MIKIKVDRINIIICTNSCFLVQMPIINNLYKDHRFWIARKLCNIIDRDTFIINIYNNFILNIFKTRYDDKSKSFVNYDNRYLNNKQIKKELDYWLVFN